MSALTRWQMQKRLPSPSEPLLGIGEIESLRQAISVGSGRLLAAANRFNQFRLKPCALSVRRCYRKGYKDNENHGR
jgi:hypothetical protein